MCSEDVLLINVDSAQISVHSSVKYISVYSTSYLDT